MSPPVAADAAKSAATRPARPPFNRDALGSALDYASCGTVKDESCAAQKS